MTAFPVYNFINLVNTTMSLITKENSFKFQVGPGEMRKLPCTIDLTGRYMIIQANEPTTRILTICEMRVLQKDTT